MKSNMVRKDAFRSAGADRLKIDPIKKVETDDFNIVSFCYNNAIHKKYEVNHHGKEQI